MSHPRLYHWLILILFVTVILPATAPAQPPDSGFLVCGAAHEQVFASIVSDGFGGMYVAWLDYRDNNTDIYAQRMDGTGAALWTADGIPIATGSHNQEMVDIVTDGAGGAVVVWKSAPDEIRAQRLDSSGAKLWYAPGVRVYFPNEAFDVLAVADGAGGVIVGWREDRSGDFCVYAQRLDAAGYEIWATDGQTVFNNPTEDALWFDMAPDGSGGALFTSATSNTIRAQRIYASGTGWVSTGFIVHSPTVLTTPNPVVCSDGAGGMYVAWYDRTGGGGNTGIIARRVDGSGTVQWGSPSVVADSLLLEQNPDIIDDGTGCAVVCFEVNGPDQWDIRAQKIDAFGSPLWAPYGVPLCVEHDDQLAPVIAGRTNSGIVVAFEHHSGGDQIRAQKINASGYRLWPAQGVGVLWCDAHGGGWDVASDGAGGMLAAVSDDRLMQSLDVYAETVNSGGGTSDNAPDIRSIADVPDDQGGWVRITIGPSGRDSLGVTEQAVARYDVWHRIDESAAPAIARASTRAGPAPAGVRRVAVEGRELLIAGPEAVVPQGTWDLVGSFAAAQEAQYTYRAPTVADSSGGGTAWSVYFVSAHTTDPWVWFASTSDSGYSVDNIPPQVPANFAVAYNTGGGNHLTWDPCPDDDFAYFRVYRDESPTFTPDPANLVHSTTGADWWNTVSEGWKYYYKITAVDHAGNESGWTSGTATGTGSTPRPREFALGPNVPNPFNPSTTVYFDVPRRAAVELDVYDVQGRHVRTLARRYFEPGRRYVHWDGRDDLGNPVASGVYVYRLTAPGYAASRKMTLIR